MPARAAIIPLDYGDRVENSLVYVSTDWDELDLILDDPRQWFREKGEGLWAKAWRRPSLGAWIRLRYPD